jgi:hypothetical protein
LRSEILDYKEIEQLVRTRAYEIANVKDLIIKFSNLMRRNYALCYWQEIPQAIHLNKKFVDANINNYVVMNELIVHECVHLLPGYARHTKKFCDKCRSFGVEPYGFSTNYNRLDPLFRSICLKCHSCKSYYAKPRKIKCELCNGKLEIIRS